MCEQIIRVARVRQHHNWSDAIRTDNNQTHARPVLRRVCKCDRADRVCADRLVGDVRAVGASQFSVIIGQRLFAADTT